MGEEALRETIVRQSREIKELGALIKRKDEYIELLREEKRGGRENERNSL